MTSLDMSGILSANFGDILLYKHVFISVHNEWHSVTIVNRRGIHAPSEI